MSEPTNAPTPHVVTTERAAHQARLTAIEDELATDRSDVELLFERARILDVLGRDDAAREAYLDLMRRDGAHAGGLNEFGRFLERTGYRAAARSTFARAAALHPGDPVGHGNLANILLDDGDVEGARRHYERATEIDPQHVAANACLAILHLRCGDAERAKRHAAIGFRGGATAWPYRGAGAALGILVISSALGGNVVTAYDIDDRTFAKWTLVAEFDDPATALPPHRLVFNAIGDADRCAAAFPAATAILARTNAPVINAPARVRRTGREENARRFAGLPGVVAPLTLRYARHELSTAEAARRLDADGFTWPLIVRAPGFHTGEHCVLVPRPSALPAALAGLPGDDVLAIAFIDVRRCDGLVRKYRTMIVDGELFPLHLARSTHWKVHYFRADMIGEPDHRREEAAFLDDMPGVLGPTAMASLHAIKDCLGLDYGGIDFALDETGRVVVFEANATMIVPPVPRGDPAAQRHAAVDRIRAAVRTMLLARAGAAAVESG